MQKSLSVPREAGQGENPFFAPSRLPAGRHHYRRTPSRRRTSQQGTKAFFEPPFQFPNCRSRFRSIGSQRAADPPRMCDGGKTLCGQSAWNTAGGNTAGGNTAGGNTAGGVDVLYVPRAWSRFCTISAPNSRRRIIGRKPPRGSEVAVVEPWAFDSGSGRSVLVLVLVHHLFFSFSGGGDAKLGRQTTFSPPPIQ